MITGKKDLEEQLTKLRDTIVVQFKHAKDLMDQKGL